MGGKWTSGRVELFVCAAASLQVLPWHNPGRNMLINLEMGEILALAVGQIVAYW